MIDEAAEDMRTKHSSGVQFHQRTQTLDERSERWVGISDGSFCMSRTVKHVAELGFEEDTTAISKIIHSILRHFRQAFSAT